ncbi:LuxR C-terminal-related transcriptional regulator [Camelliibacillus cellulosilyticus]|uniref:LuxR C-terminal-related transcriptional regulator n=1 Tax=Camelliibacillus cellulosilyticus TaxID=2174486 RepID=A0ABV9GH56_9BACL
MIITTKIHVPKIRHRLVSRQQLMEKLNKGLSKALTLVTAPPGYGKSTLLSEWAVQTGAHVAWVSLDQGDNVPTRFWMHTVAALKEADEHFDEQMLLDTAGEDPFGEALIASLINNLHRSTATKVIIWDDFHCIQDQRLLDGLSYFLERLPNNIHLFIASRTHPPLALSRLRATGGLIELTVDHLRFSMDEAMAFIQDCTDATMSNSDIATLYDRMEGWIAGLNMAALSFHDHGDLLKWMQTLTGRHRDFSDYFFEEVLSKQNPSVQGFLLKTSILDRVSDHLSVAVTEMEDAPNILREIEAANLFFISLDGAREWFRYHHLFQQFLRAELERQCPEQIPLLHKKAGQWMEENGHTQEALDHYISGRNYHDAMRLIEKKLPSLDNVERVALHQWLNDMPNPLLLKKPLLYLTNIASLFLSGHITDATDKYWWAARELDNGGHGLTCEEDNLFRAGLDVLVAFRTFIEKDFDYVVPYSKAYLQRDPDGDLFIGFGHDPDGSHIMLDIYISSSHLKKAENILLDLLKIWSNTKNALFYAHLCTDYGKLLYEWNRLDEAERYARRAYDIGKKENNKNIIVHAGLLITQIFLARGHHGMVDVSLRQLDFDIDHRRYPKLYRKVAWLQGYIYWRKDEGGKALQWLKNCGLDAVDELSRQRIDHYTLLAHVLTDQGMAEEAIRLLERLLLLAIGEGQDQVMIQLYLLKSAIYINKGKTNRGFEILEEALSLAEPEGYIRTFVDAGKTVHHLLTQYIQRRQNNHYQSKKHVTLAYVKKLLMASDSGWSSTIPHGVQPLTPKELIVLELIQSGYSNKEMARQLHISHSTVKTHINNLFRKLNVNNRVLALERARELKLI